MREDPILGRVVKVNELLPSLIGQDLEALRGATREAIKKLHSVQALAKKSKLSESTIYRLLHPHGNRPRSKTLDKLLPFIELYIDKNIWIACHKEGERRIIREEAYSRAIPNPQKSAADRKRQGKIERMQLDSTSNQNKEMTR